MFLLSETRDALQSGTVAGMGSKDAAAPLQHRSVSQKIYGHGLKRLLDIVMSLVLIPVLMPILLVIWLMVRRDGGPGLFIQSRVGLDGREFHCLKFRSMVQNAEKVLEDMCAKDPTVAAEWLKYQKLKKDPRISRIGRFLRKTSLDELPQIFNVLKGDMSLVGPRPFLPSQKALYDEAGGHSYYRCRPGITGPWQVFGRSATTFKARVEFDESYYHKLSLGADFSLLLRTVMVVIRPTGR